jgi:hypothetical protein
LTEYEDFLKRARAEGWRDPVQITDLEIKAYQAGVIMERKRVLAIFKQVDEEKPMRAMDIGRFIYRIKNPNNKV